MTFTDIPAGVAVFVDTNTFVYYFMPHLVFGPPCKALLEKMEHQELRGFTSAYVLSEMAHRLMTLEAMALFGWPQQGTSARLKRHPAEVQRLGRYRQALDEIPLLNFQVLPSLDHLVSLAADVSRQTGLLSGDALIVSTMQAHGLTHLASHDADFDRVPGLTRYAPA
jgi:predicted nucleic acid-binding protein